MNYPIELDKTYVTRDGMRVYAAMLHSCNADIMIGYGDDGIYHHYRRDNGKSHICIGYSGGLPMNWPRLDLVSESLGLPDLRDEHFAYQRHGEEQRRVHASLEGQPDRYARYREWCRKNRPPGPLRPGMKESDYES